MFFKVKKIFENYFFFKPGLLNNFSFIDLFKIFIFVNLNKKTLLCEYMVREGSDKGMYFGEGKHNYTPIYHSLLSRYRRNEISLFELGLGTNNLNFESNMGVNGKPGASLRAWKKYFPLGEVFGADIDKSVLFEEERIKTFFCDQTNPSSIKRMWSENFESGFCFDIMIEDGLHSFFANKIFLENSFHKLKSKGVYIIEDVSRSEIGEWIEYLPNFSKINNDIKFLILKIPNQFNPHDNNLVMIFKF